MNHSKEPWYLDYDIADEEGFYEEPWFTNSICDAEGRIIADGLSKEDAERIVLCVNMCAGITNEVLMNGLKKQIDNGLIEPIFTGAVDEDGMEHWINKEGKIERR